MSEIILINITGRDRKGLDAAITNILSQYEVNILDIGQAVIHNYISFGILIEIPCEHQSSSVLKDLLFECHKLELNLDMTPVNNENYEKWVSEQGKERRIITLLGTKLSAEQISRVSSVIADNDLNIDVITRLSGRMSLKNPDINPKRASVRFAVSGKTRDVESMRANFIKISQETGIDISFYADNIYRKNRKLVVFDMDSTLIQAEVIDELAKLAGVGDEVSAITESAMRGEIDFDESFRRRVRLLKGLEEDKLKNLCIDLPLTEGAERLTKVLKDLGYKLGILSGGFTFVGEYLKNKLNFDYVYANELDMKDGKVTGNVNCDIVNGEKKASLLREIAQKENIRLEQTIAVGDGANDLPMISIAGLGVAFHAKPIVKEKAENTISSTGLDGLLYLIGIHEREIIANGPESEKTEEFGKE